MSNAPHDAHPEIEQKRVPTSPFSTRYSHVVVALAIRQALIVVYSATIVVKWHDRHGNAQSGVSSVQLEVGCTCRGTGRVLPMIYDAIGALHGNRRFSKSIGGHGDSP